MNGTPVAARGPGHARSLGIFTVLLLNMCDRIMVLHQGSVTGIAHRDESSEEPIMALATGVAVA